MRKTLVLLAVASLATLGVACGDEDGGGETGMDEDTIHVADAWARSPMQDVGAVYFVAHNGAEEEDRLVGVSTDAADRAEVHETVEQDGQIVMQPVEAVAIPPGEDVSFEPGGYHIMLFELTEPLEVDTTIALTLEFELAGEVEIQALVKAFVPEDGMDMGDETSGPTGSTADAGVG
jgi:copper(I)-binding protein